MAYTVEMRPRAQRMADRLWRTSHNPVAMQGVIDRIVARLADDPEGNGDPFDAEHMALYEHPLGAVYRIDDAAKAVYIIELWHLHEDEDN